MDLRLVRTDYFKDGIFSELQDEGGRVLFHTVEHAYETTPGQYTPKIPKGEFTCKRSMHQLHSMNAPFQTFEVNNVPNHSNILFHVGNYNEDSDGCILVGTDKTRIGAINMVTGSKAAFQRFMDLQKGTSSFILKVT